MKTICELLKGLREENKLSLQEIAIKTGINKTLLSRIETGKRLPTKDQLLLLADTYQTDRQSLLTHWLSKKILAELQDEEARIEALTLAEDKLHYTLQKKLPLIGDLPERKPILDFINKVIQGDCPEVMQEIPDKSIDMILCDLPYGTTQNTGKKKVHRN